MLALVPPCLVSLSCSSTDWSIWPVRVSTRSKNASSGWKIACRDVRARLGILGQQRPGRLQLRMLAGAVDLDPVVVVARHVKRIALAVDGDAVRRRSLGRDA